jgi:hypothetical protein
LEWELRQEQMEEAMEVYYLLGYSILAGKF